MELTQAQALEIAITRQALHTLFDETTTDTTHSESQSLLRRLLVDDPKFELVLALLPLGQSKLKSSYREKQSLSVTSVDSTTSTAAKPAGNPHPQPSSSTSTTTSTTTTTTNTTATTATAPTQQTPGGLTEKTDGPHKPPSRSLSSQASSNVADAILSLFNHGPRGEAHVLGLIQTIQTVEVEGLSEDKVTQLFRGNTLGCKIVSTFTASVGQQYLQHVVTPLIAQTHAALQHGVDFKDASSNARDIVLTTCLEHVLSSFDACPYTMGTICKHLREIVRQRFPKHSNVALSSFLFLRFFCPAIVSPSPELFPHNVGTLSKELRRALIWVAKAVQCLANHTNIDHPPSGDSAGGKAGEKVGEKTSGGSETKRTKPVSWPLTLDALDMYREKMLAYFDKVCDLDPSPESTSGGGSHSSHHSSHHSSDTRPHDRMTFGDGMEPVDVISLSHLVRDNIPILAEMIVRQRHHVDQERNRSSTNQKQSQHTSESSSSDGKGGKSSDNHPNRPNRPNRPPQKIQTTQAASAASDTSSPTAFLFSKMPSIPFMPSWSSNNNGRSNTTTTTTSNGKNAKIKLRTQLSRSNSMDSELENSKTPAMLVSKLPSLALHDAMALQGSSLHLNHNTLISEYYYCLVQKMHHRLHQYMAAMDQDNDRGSFRRCNSSSGSSSSSSSSGGSHATSSTNGNGRRKKQRTNSIDNNGNENSSNLGGGTWQHIRTDSTTSNHSISTYHHQEHPTLLMERAYFPVTSEQFYQRLSSCTTRVQWDDACLQCHEVERISPSCSVLHSVVKTPSVVVSNRDYVYLQSHGPDVLDDGEDGPGHKRMYVVVSTSIERPDCYPIKGLVRGSIDFEGFVIEEQEGDPLACIATHIVSIDHKGWIPSMFTRALLVDRQTSVLNSVAESLFTSVEDVAL